MTEEYITCSDSDEDEDMKKLEQRCLNAKPVLRSSAKQPKPASKSNSKKFSDESLDPDFLRPFNKKPKENKASQNANQVSFDSANFSAVRDMLGDASAEVQQSLEQNFEKTSNKLNNFIRIINALADRVEKLEKREATLLEQNRRQEKKINDLEKKFEAGERKANSRSVILRIPKLNTGSDSFFDEVRSFLTADLKLAKNLVELVTISKFAKEINAVLLEFPSIEAKRQLFRAKKTYNENLDDEDENENKLYINDLLTKRNYELLKLARELKNDKKIQDAYSFDGNVFIRKVSGGNRFRITDPSDLDRFSA